MSFCSSWNACPPVWKSPSAFVITSAPSLISLLITPTTEFSFPGTTEEENITVSPDTIIH